MKIVGQSLPIHDAKLKASGRAVYAGDMVLPKMVHCAVLFSTIPHGIVKKVDSSKALQLDGVIDVLDCFNTTDRKFNRFRTIKNQETIEQEQVFNSHVRFVGDRVACVVAETASIARKAVRLIEVEYEELPFSVDVGEAMSGKNSAIYDEGAVFGNFELELGNSADVKKDTIAVTTKSHLARISHLTMETHSCVASYEKFTGELTVWSPNQSVHGIRTVMCDLFELDDEKVRIIKTTMGGSFGAKQEWMLEPVAIAATMRTGRPVKLVFNRGEAIVSTISRCPIDSEFTMNVTRDGQIQSISSDITLDAGAYLGNSADYIKAISSKFYRCYKFPYLKFKGRAVCTNTPVSGAFRGWSGPETYIMLEHCINMAARKLDIDPAEFRLRNVAHPGDSDIKNGVPLGEIRIEECIKLGIEKFGWDEKKRLAAEFNKDNTRFKRGVGIGCGGHVNGYYPRMRDFGGVDMRMTENGGVIVNITLHDHGCGTVTAVKMIVAEALGISPDSVIVREGDTAYTPLDVGCFASRTTFVLGKAAQDCAEKLKQRLIDGVAESRKSDAGSFEIKDAYIVSRDGSVKLDYAEAVTEIVAETQKEVWVLHQHINGDNPGVTGAHFAYVEVDTATGMTKILDYLAVHDIGQAINKEMCVAQIQGAVIMGAGAALTEKISVNAKTGRPITSMKDYHVINIAETPNVNVELIEDGGKCGPFGAKSIGEMSHVPVAPTIIGAVNDALQSELCSLPLHPDTIVALMRERAGRNAQ